MVTSSVRTATASINGGPAVSLPMVRDVEPGRYRIRLTADGYLPFDGERDVVEGQFRVVEIDLAPRPSQVTVRSAPGAQLAIDGRSAGALPLARPLTLPSGQHHLRVALRGHQPWTREVSLGRGENTLLDADLEPTGQRLAATWVLRGAAVVAVGSGVAAVLAFAASNEAADINQEREDQGISRARQDDYEAAVDRRGRYVTTSLALLGVGGALAACGGLLYWLDNPSPQEGAPAAAEPLERAQLRVTPVVSGPSVGLTLGGRF